eukprot:Nitzschia sp. Nitz4//scaffold171_size48012//6507//7925//NITZ4_007119-RA/size48012-augustus-gene-0.21-mRNA-1//1//CDS//3329538683//5094//frame0
MKLTVKTLSGGKFEVECEPSQSVAEVKSIIEKAKAELVAANMKLIHSGKVLKDDQTVEACGIKPSDFLVVMITKPKKAAAAPAPAKAPETPAPAKPAAEAPAAAAPAPVAATPAPAAAAATPAAPTRPSEPQVSDEAVSNLMAMGFPEPEVRHCLRAANGNPDIAVEFLTNGIPPGLGEATAAVASMPSPSAQSGGETLSALRNHPQFNDLRRLVQTNPQMLQSVLTQIGQKQPDLLAEINANQETFMAMMNEPLTESSSTPAAQPPAASPAARASAGAAGARGLPPGLADGMANPAQIAQMLEGMGPDELNQMAQAMGLSPEHLRTTAQMLGQIPPEQLQMYMSQAMQEGLPPGMGGMLGGAGEGEGDPMGLQLNEEERAAVTRLTEMGFNYIEAAQAFLACDKNEALAANLLMDSMGDGGAFGGDGNNGDDDGDDMYD